MCCRSADTSERGLERSHGIMVNYRYDLDQLSVNNKAYLLQRKVAAAPEVEALLRLHPAACEQQG
jgi:malonyl-CoA decarboxylase